MVSTFIQYKPLENRNTYPLPSLQNLWLQFNLKYLLNCFSEKKKKEFHSDDTFGAVLVVFLYIAFE